LGAGSLRSGFWGRTISTEVPKALAVPKRDFLEPNCCKCRAARKKQRSCIKLRWQECHNGCKNAARICRTYTVNIIWLAARRSPRSRARAYAPSAVSGILVGSGGWL
jgi:hypothetical protein